MSRLKQTHVSPQVRCSWALAVSEPHPHIRTHFLHLFYLFWGCVLFLLGSPGSLLLWYPFFSSNWSWWSELPWKPVQKVLAGGLPKARIRLAVMTFCNQHGTVYANRKQSTHQNSEVVYRHLFNFHQKYDELKWSYSGVKTQHGASAQDSLNTEHRL